MPARSRSCATGLESEFKIRAIYSGADMSKPAEIEAMVKEATAKLGSVDILVNNAGIQHVSPIQNFPPEKWDAVIAINLSSAFHAVRVALPQMLERNWGRIINIASAHGLVASVDKVGLCGGEARPGRPDQGGGAGDRENRRHLQRRSVRAGC